jgi:cytochrome d ubiquinol oxidase subunit II
MTFTLLMFYWILTVVVVSIVFYVLLGGADFGAGIVEIFTPRRLDSRAVQALTYRSMGPVWEANHIWVIILAVVLMSVFPSAWSRIATALHIPIALMLLGIVLRGASFMFRHYDAYDDRSRGVYTAVFAVSSLLTPIFLGTTAGAVILGQISLEPTNYYDGFVAPWLNPFALAVGLFTASICTFLAAAYLIGEAALNPELQRHFRRLALISNGVTVVAGGLVFLAAFVQNRAIFDRFFGAWEVLDALILATLALPVFWWAVNHSRYALTRLVAGFQILVVLLAWLGVQYPVLVNLRDGEPLTVYNTAAPDVTLNVLGVVLIIGVLVIFPLLGYLLYTFKRQETLGAEL